MFKQLNNMLKIYTAGGFHGEWREAIKKELKDKFIIIDPLDKETDSKGERKNLDFKEFTAWDLWAIRTADIVFVYAERTNPGQGYIVEAGYAKGLGKTVILVREPNNEHMKDRYLSFIDCIADYVTDDFDDGLGFLASLSIK
jgi:nucleoside 2-deoxyribosyltransferase